MEQITTTFLARKTVAPGEILWRADPACPGLRVRLSASPTRGRSVTWYYRYKRPDGRLQPLQIGTYPHTSLDDARALVVNTLRPMARAGLDVKAEFRRHQANLRAPAPPIAELIPQYLESAERAGLAPATLKNYRRSLRPLMVWHGEVLPPAFTRGMAQDLFYRVLEEGVPESTRGGGPRAAGMALSASRAFWTWLVDHEHADSNPFARQKKLAKAGQSGISTRALSDDEIARALAADQLSHRDQTILRLMLATGLRPNECCGARWAEFDLGAGVWEIPQGRMKYKGAGHRVYLSAFAVAALRAWRKTQRGNPRYVFPARGKHQHVQSDNLAERFRRIGIPGFTPKVTRATFRTGMQRLGCPLEVRQHMSHHQAPDRVQRAYDHHRFDQEARHWWQQWGIHLERLSAGEPGLADVTPLAAVK